MNSTRDDKILKEFGKRLKKYRTTKKLSIRKLSDIADVDFSQIHRIEKGESNPTLTMILTLASALNLTVTELIGDLRI
ncbi:MAG: helix-turn-helix transcriptional regulator [Chitinophagaceae bacterium]